MGIADFTPIVNQNQSAVVGSACPCVFEAGCDREDRSSDVCYVGDTRWSFSAKKRMMTALHTHHSFRIVSHRNMVFPIPSLSSMRKSIAFCVSKSFSCLTFARPLTCQCVFPTSVHVPKRRFRPLVHPLS